MVKYKFDEKDRNKVKELSALSRLERIEHMIIESYASDDEQGCDLRIYAKILHNLNSRLSRNKITKYWLAIAESDRSQPSKL